MRQIKVTKTKAGSPDGVTVRQYEQGETYEMPDALAEVFIHEKWGTEVKIKQKPGPEENKGASGGDDDK